jgi:DNA-binding response OmpR family regulator
MVGGRGRILVVEDDVDTGTMLCELLRTQGYRVQWVTRGREAMSRLRSDVTPDVDVVLLDLMLPDVDGSVVADHMATLSRKPAVIILSSRRPGALATQAGVIGAFRKPFDVRRLLDTMAECVRGGAHLATLASAIAALRASPPRLGSSFDDRDWQPARRVVELALTHFDEHALTATSYDLSLALRAFRAAETAQRALLETFVPEGGGDLDCAVGDAYCFALLQLAFAIARESEKLGVLGRA